MDTAGCEVRQLAVVAAATVEVEHGVLGELKLTGLLDIGDLALGEDAVLGEQSIVIEEKTDCDCSFRGAVLGPVEELGVGVHEGGV